MVFERVLAAVASLALAGCNFATSIEEHPCPPDTSLTYANFGAEFLNGRCQRCHGAVGPAREGAPAAYDFGTAENARAWRERIFIRSALDNTTMPPGPDDPPEDERRKLADWLACGAP